MRGVHFVTDEKGRKVAVQVDPKKHGAIWQDFWDGLVSESRRKERAFLTSNTAPTARNAPARVHKYSIEIKQSAQKELDALDDKLFGRIDKKILALNGNPRPAGCKKAKGL